MAANQQVELLRSGSPNWNKWREQHPGVAPDLDGADLAEADLKFANLAFARLAEADLTKAKLANGILDHADLSQATLKQADLSDADLHDVNAQFASFRGASLARATLLSSNFEGADLSAANLDGAVFGFTILADTNLAGARQLETCRFSAPVAIDFRTLARSPHLPVSFLRGCGVPEEAIEILPALFTKPADRYSVFLESADEDRDFAQQLSADLQSRGVRCWHIAQSSGTRSGAEARRLLHSTSGSSAILVLSRHSLTAKWLERDVHLYVRNERLHNRKLLFPVQLDGAALRLGDRSVEALLNERVIDFRRWKERKPYTNALASLVASLSA